MAERRRIALIFSNNENWIGGTYYILNLVHALAQLEDERKPELLILSTAETDLRPLKAIGYPYTSYHNYEVQTGFFQSILNKAWRTITGKNIIEKRFSSRDADVIFPAADLYYLELFTRRIYWIPDFQEYHLPGHFSEEEIARRKSYHSLITQKDTHIILSSNDALKDLRTFFPHAKAKAHVLNFAVTHPKYNDIDIVALKKKHGITSAKYFISPNQFWTHKNHITLIKAAALLGDDVQVIFTGKEHDYRSPNYTRELKKYVEDHSLENKIKFLGFIDRREQLALMKHAAAVVQPSLFEGWSTVVEDAKAMGQLVVASDIAVHREQLQQNGIFFEPQNEHELASKLKNIEGFVSRRTRDDYSDNVKNFGVNFLSIVEEACFAPLRPSQSFGEGLKLCESEQVNDKSTSDWPWSSETPVTYDPAVRWPKITIITPSYNQGQFLEETILSVINQNYPNLEYMVIDGGSTDNSLNIIKKYSPQLSYWVSERDKGQSDAINKGLQRATGDIFNWLNSDDYYEPGALKKVAEAFMSDPATTCVMGLERRIAADGKFKNISFGTTVLDTAEETAARAHIDQPSTFFRFEAIKKIGFIDESLRYCMDVELWVRYILAFGIKGIKKIPDVLVSFRYHDHSKTSSQLIHFTEEIRQIDTAIARSAGGEEAAKKVWSGSSNAITNKSYDLGKMDRALLTALLIKKHQPYKDDKSLRYRELAAYYQTMKLGRQGLSFAAKAISIEPFRPLNYKFLAAYLFKMLAK